jgi:mannuronan 5-epimerase
VVGGQLSANGSGPINVDEPVRIQLYGIDLRTPQRELGYRLGGALLAFQVDVLDILMRRKQVTVLEAKLSSERATAQR